MLQLLRPRWSGLYAARKKQKDAASSLPQLPPTFFGWIPVLWRITEEEVLASAGLDAFVFLRFFKLAVKYLAFVFFFVLTVIYPVQSNFDKSHNKDSDGEPPELLLKRDFGSLFQRPSGNGTGEPWMEFPTDYLWIYVVFAYLFSGAAIYLIVTETNYIIKVRQKFLSTQSSVTDRTIRLSGIPKHLRSEELIRDTIENLQIGKVERVTLCKQWQELDELLEARMSVLRKLEEAWTVYLGYRRNLRKLEPFRPPPSTTADEGHEECESDDNDETTGLIRHREQDASEPATPAKSRPTTRIWYGFLKLQSHKVDAIDYFEDKLRVLDEQIEEARQKHYPPSSLAFVTLDSIAATQMAIQAILDPVPMQLRAKVAPAPSDVVWKNTYLTRKQRMTKAWTVTAFVVLLTVIWWVIFFPVAALLNIDAIGKVLPGLQDFLCGHELTRSLVTSTLPTLILSLMLVLIPYLYDCMCLSVAVKIILTSAGLSNKQGMTSQGDVEMSVISKNFFFTFFNLFISFTLFGTAAKAYTNLEEIRKRFNEIRTGGVMYILATSLGQLSDFYTNLIALQAIGLSPFRLLEFGTVSLYPFGLMGSKTPRDYAELVQPPVFSYGFYLPQILFIFLICMVYSIMPRSEWMILFGLIYFFIGGFIYKYQLLYAMDHRRLSTGRAWIMICNRIVVGLFVFQVAMAAELGFKLAAQSGAEVIRTALFIPLIIGTGWFGYVYNRTYEPLMTFISLRSLQEAASSDSSSTESRADRDPRINTRDADLAATSYINPCLVLPLEDAWLALQTPHVPTFSTNEGNGNAEHRA